MSSKNFPPNGQYVGKLCHVAMSATQSGSPALLIRFAVQHDDMEYSPTAFWSFSKSAAKYIRQRCEDIGITYGDIKSVQKQLLSKVGMSYDLDIQNASNGFPQIQFTPSKHSEDSSAYFDFDVDDADFGEDSFQEDAVEECTKPCQDNTAEKGDDIF